MFYYLLIDENFNRGGGGGGGGAWPTNLARVDGCGFTWGVRTCCRWRLRS